MIGSLQKEMTVKLRYRVVLEGTYEVDPVDSGFDTTDPNEMADQDRDWATTETLEWMTSDEVYDTLKVTEILILPV